MVSTRFNLSSIVESQSVRLIRVEWGEGLLNQYKLPVWSKDPVARNNFAHLNPTVIRGDRFFYAKSLASTCGSSIERLKVVEHQECGLLRRRHMRHVPRNFQV